MLLLESEGSLPVGRSRGDEIWVLSLDQEVILSCDLYVILMEHTQDNETNLTKEENIKPSI